MSLTSEERRACAHSSDALSCTQDMRCLDVRTFALTCELPFVISFHDHCPGKRRLRIAEKGSFCWIAPSASLATDASREGSIDLGKQISDLPHRSVRLPTCATCAVSHPTWLVTASALRGQSSKSGRYFRVVRPINADVRAARATQRGQRHRPQDARNGGRLARHGGDARRSRAPAIQVPLRLGRHAGIVAPPDHLEATQWSFTKSVRSWRRTRC